MTQLRRVLFAYICHSFFVRSQSRSSNKTEICTWQNTCIHTQKRGYNNKLMRRIPTPCHWHCLPGLHRYRRLVLSTVNEKTVKHFHKSSAALCLSIRHIASNDVVHKFATTCYVLSRNEEKQHIIVSLHHALKCNLYY